VYKHLLTMISFYSLLIFVTSAYYLYILIAKLWIKKQDRSVMMRRLAQKWGRILLKRTIGWQLTIKRDKNIKLPDKPVIFIANHQSYADIFILYHLEHLFYWLAKENLFRWPIIGPIMQTTGYIAIKRGNFGSERRAIISCRKLLEKGESILLFPEGTRSSNKLGYFKSGAFRLAAKTGRPIVPIIIHTTHQLFSGHFMPCPGSAKLEILDPVYIPENKTEMTNTIEKIHNLYQKHLTSNCGDPHAKDRLL